MKRLLFLVLLLSEVMWAQVTEFPYNEGFEQTFELQEAQFIPNWSGSHPDGIRLYQENTRPRSGESALGLWPVVEEGAEEEEVEVFAQVNLDLTGMENPVARFWLATEATGDMKHLKIFMQASRDGGITFSSRLPLASDHRGFENVDSQFMEFLYPFHPELWDEEEVVLRFVAKAGARKGTSAKALIDDVSIYAADKDVFPPVALEPKILNTSQIQIEFSEPLGSSAGEISNYSLNSFPAAGTVDISATGDRVILNLSTPLAIGKYYELGIANVKDEAGNVMEPKTSTIIFNPLQSGLVITEIMYDEPPVKQNDDLEFLELYNATDQPIPLGGLRIKGGITSGRLPEYTLEPGEFWITAKNATAFTEFFGIPAYEWHGANLSNDDPETVYIINTVHHSDVRVDRVTYSVGSPWPEAAAGGGHSMELCDPRLDNNNPSNWAAATHFAGIYKGYEIYASPGKSCCKTPLIVDAGADRMVFPGLPEKFQCAEVAVKVTGGTPPYRYTWKNLSGDPLNPLVEICPETTTTYVVSVTDATGCKGEDQLTVYVSDIQGKEKVLMCYEGRTYDLPPAAVRNFLSKGAVPGACEGSSDANTSIALVDLKASPNPSAGFIKLSLRSPRSSEILVAVYNLAGIQRATLYRGMVEEGVEYNFELDARDWPNGYYVFVVTQEGRNISESFVIQK